MKPHKLLLKLFVFLLLVTLFAASCPSRTPAQYIRWYWYGNCTTCQNGQCKPSTKPQNNANKEEPDKQDAEPQNEQSEAAESGLTSLFDGVDADKWEQAIKDVCDRRHVNYGALLKKHPWKIPCYNTWSSSFAGCTYSAGNGRVQKVEIVPSNCYDIEAVRRHEASHVVTFIVEQNVSLFMHEGLSQCQERAGRDRAYLEKAGNQLRTNESLLDWVNVSGYDGSLRVYTYSYAVFRYLELAGGTWWTEAFVMEVNNGKSFQKALKDWFGLSEEQLNANVRLLIEHNKIKALY